jgi:hypothetical protein
MQSKREKPNRFFPFVLFVLRDCGGNFFHERKTSQRPVATEIFRKRNITVPPAPPSKKHSQKNNRIDLLVRFGVFKVKDFGSSALGFFFD